jgi:hypothetical protein
MWGWSGRSPKWPAGSALGDGMVPVERAVHNRGTYFQHRVSAPRRPAHLDLKHVSHAVPIQLGPSLAYRVARLDAVDRPHITATHGIRLSTAHQTATLLRRPRIGTRPHKRYAPAQPTAAGNVQP